MKILVGLALGALAVVGAGGYLARAKLGRLPAKMEALMESCPPISGDAQAGGAERPGDRPAPGPERATAPRQRRRSGRRRSLEAPATFRSGRAGACRDGCGWMSAGTAGPRRAVA